MVDAVDEEHVYEELWRNEYLLDFLNDGDDDDGGGGVNVPYFSSSFLDLLRLEMLN